jgi:hypothetical protein
MGVIFVPGWNGDLFSLDVQEADFGDHEGLGYNVTHIKTGLKVASLTGLCRMQKISANSCRPKPTGHLIPLIWMLVALLLRVLVKRLAKRLRG